MLYISVITLMEAKGYNFSSKKEEILIDTLCENLIKADLTNGVIETVISLRKINKIKLPDAIILATAIENNLKLITRNTKDFNVAAPSDIVFNPFRII